MKQRCQPVSLVDVWTTKANIESLF